MTASQVGRGGEGVVGAGEGGVYADHAPPAFRQEPVVLGQPGVAARFAVAIGHPVRARHPHADLGARIGDDRQRAVDGVG